MDIFQKTAKVNHNNKLCILFSPFLHSVQLGICFQGFFLHSSNAMEVHFSMIWIFRCLGKYYLLESKPKTVLINRSLSRYRVLQRVNSALQQGKSLNILYTNTFLKISERLFQNLNKALISLHLFPLLYKASIKSHII